METAKNGAGTPLLEPDGVFVVHLRADSDPRGRRVSGRIEHVMTGAIEPFARLEHLLDFMARHLGAAGVGSPSLAAAASDPDNRSR